MYLVCDANNSLISDVYVIHKKLVRKYGENMFDQTQNMFHLIPNMFDPIHYDLEHTY